MTVLPFSPRGNPVKQEERNEEPQKRSIVLPMYVWKALDLDAKRCRRSATKQIEALLVRYYNLDPSMELDEEALIETHHAVSHRTGLKKSA